MIEPKYISVSKMTNKKMKGLLKGLRYISQIFENEKETEMQIGQPTDVKHVAHIGLDGPSVNAPSWMNEFKSPSGFATPGQLAGDGKDDSSAKGAFEGSSRKGGRVRDSPGLPKSSRKSASDSPIKEKSDKSKRRSSAKDASDGSGRSSRRSKEDHTSRHNGPPEIPEKPRRKKSKDSVEGGSSRSSRTRRAPAADADQMSETGSVYSASHHGDDRTGF